MEITQKMFEHKFADLGHFIICIRLLFSWTCRANSFSTLAAANSVFGGTSENVKLQYLCLTVIFEEVEALASSYSTEEKMKLLNYSSIK
jgi:hypothetical protein